MALLPEKLKALPDGEASGAREIFGDIYSDWAHIESAQNVVNSFYDLSQEQPNIISNLALWGFLSDEWGNAHGPYPDTEWLENEDFGVLSATESHEEWLKRLLSHLTSSADASHGLDLLIEPPVSFKIEGNLYTEFRGSDTDHESILLVRDDAGTLRVFLYDPLDDFFEF